MDLKRWKHVLAVADRRSFVRAAEQVHLSQSALTRSIQAAEEELGLVLFDRGTQEVTVTPAGEFVVARARQLVFNSHCLERDVALLLNRGLGDTAFGVGPFPAGTFVPTLLADLRREYPQVNLRVEISNWELLVKRLLEEDIEFFVADTRDLPANPLLQVTAMREEPGGFYVRRGHPLARRRSVPIREVWGFGVATVRLPASVRALLSRLLAAEPGTPLQLALECDNLHVLRTVAMNSESVLAAPHAAVAAEVASGELRLLNVPELPTVAAQMGIVALRGRTPSPMAALILERLAGGLPQNPKSASHQTLS